jgi:hypothetical protein
VIPVAVAISIVGFINAGHVNFGSGVGVGHGCCRVTDPDLSAGVADADASVRIPAVPRPSAESDADSTIGATRGRVDRLLLMSRPLSDRRQLPIRRLSFRPQHLVEQSLRETLEEGLVR